MQPLTQRASSKHVSSKHASSKHASSKHVCSTPSKLGAQVGEHQTSAPETSAPETRVPAQLATLQRLAREIEHLETGGGRAAPQSPRSSAGCAAMDALLPGGGYAAGSVVEYLRSTPACGASSLAWAAAAAAMRQSQGFLVVVDTQHNIYPPPLTSHGIDLAKVIFVRPQSQADALWAVDQALRTSAVAAVFAELERIDERSARRLQLAAESAGGLALLVRSSAARRQPSWAEVQWLVRSQANRRWHVQLVRARGGQTGRSTLLELDPLNGQFDQVASSFEPLAQADIPRHANLERTSYKLAPTSSLAIPSRSQRHESASPLAAQPALAVKPAPSAVSPSAPSAVSPSAPSPGAVHLAAQLAHTAHRLPAADSSAHPPAAAARHDAATRRAAAG